MQTPVRPLLAALALCACASPIVRAQALAPAAPVGTTPAAGTKEAEEAKRKKAEEARKDDTVALTPFEVRADASDTYDATNTNSVTGTNTSLSKTPLDAKVFNRQLMDELGVVDMTEMLWKLGGLGPAVINAGDDVRGTLEGDRQDPKSMTMRGLQINNPRRDGFLRSDTTLLDSFDIERVEAIGGSNSLLFGSGDAGGVITSASKRAYINRRPTGSVTATGDSEGSRRYTFDAQAGGKYFAMRVNAVTSDLLNFRPGLRQQAEGLQLAATVQPWKRLQIRGEYRHYTRDTIFAQAVTVTAPTSLVLPATDPLGYPTINSNKTNLLINGANTRYLVGLPAAQSFLNGVFDVTKVDSATGPFTRDAYVNVIRSVVAEATLAEGLALQVRYGHDARINDALRPSTTNVFAPGATGNLYANPVTGQVGQDWAFNTSMTATPFWTGARGYRAALAYQKDLRRWGRHQASVFHQDMDSWTNQQPWRFYEVGADGKTIQNIANVTNTESGRIVMPSTWLPIFPNQIIGGKEWRNYYVQHPNGKTYHYEPQIYSGAVAPTAGNPMGLSGAVSATTGNPSNTTYTMDDTRETSSGASLFSEWWRGHIDTMLGYRREKAAGYRNHIGVERPANSYDSMTLGTVVDTPIRGLRVSANYSTNAKINFDTTRDIFNQSLPSGKGVSKDIGLKFDLWDRRVSGNANYYVSEGRNFIAQLGNRDDIDPAGINGRNGGPGYLYSKTSNGINVTLSSRPLHGWEIRLNVATADGREKSDVTLPQFYNDQFNTTTVSGQTVVGIKASPTSTVTPLMVPSVLGDPNSPQIPLSLAMLKDPTGSYYAMPDTESGQITNANVLTFMRMPGVGTGVTGLPVSENQLGFVSPSGGGFIARRAGEKTTGYAERAYSLINRYQFSEGRLRGLTVGLSTSYQQNYRAWMYNDMLDGNRRKMFYFPDRFLNDVFLTYRFAPVRRIRTYLQVNVANAFDANRVLMLRSSSNGAFRYAQWFNAPRKLSITTGVAF